MSETPAVPEQVVRPNISLMTQEQKLDEILQHMRNVDDAFRALEQSPMFAALMSGQNPIMAMMGR